MIVIVLRNLLIYNAPITKNEHRRITVYQTAK